MNHIDGCCKKKKKIDILPQVIHWQRFKWLLCGDWKQELEASSLLKV